MTITPQIHRTSSNYGSEQRTSAIKRLITPQGNIYGCYYVNLEEFLTNYKRDNNRTEKYKQ